MSKRPSTATALLSRLRRPVGRLRDLPIWSKLGLIMIVPIIATIVVGSNGLVRHIETSNNADRARTLSKLSSDVGLLVHELQDERSAATMLLSTTAAGAAQSATVEAYRKRFEPTDKAQGNYSLRRGGLRQADLPVGFRTLLRRLDSQISALPALREQVASRKDVSLTYTAFFYRVLIADLLAIRDSSAQLAGETSLSDRMRAAAAISGIKEFLSQERVVVLRALGEGSLPPARVRDFVAALTGQEQALQTFSVVATPEERALFEQRVSGDDLRLAEKYEGQIESLLGGGGRLTDLEFNPTQWDNAQRERANLLRRVEVELDAAMETQATQLRDDVVRQVLAETGLLLAMLLLAILFAWMVARSMARSLRELRHGALAVAQHGLPHAVARLRDPALTGQSSPAQVAALIADPLPVRSRDEFGQVTEAFNAVHMEAVRTAAEQAALRSSVATMFVNLARRSQILVDRLIGHLDRLERGEEDPDRLGELFQLDHLATRMRRNDENLLVLAGADSTRVQREPAQLLDVLRAAQSEVEHYTRVEFGVIDRDIEVAAHAVNDLVHLVAELLDNATAFSPPDAPVIVEARRVGDRAVLLVEDRGIGISPDQLAELNEKLAMPPLVDVAVSRMMGLVVVARLAARHGVAVELRPAPERGIIADVTLPTSALVPRALTGRVQPGGRDLGPARDEPVVAPPRPTFSTPLALESGPATAPRPAEPRPAEHSFRAFESPADDDLAGLRGLPAWSDLTGISGVNGAEPYLPTRQNGPGAPLPQRRPGDHRTVDGEVTGSTPLIPRQLPRPNGVDPDLTVIPPVSAPPLPVSGPPAPVSAPPADPPAPPVWPPVAAPASSDTTPPAVPGELAAALDMTAEIPKVRPEGDPAGPPVRPADPRVTRYADETMELPIFRELESAWFRTRRSMPDTAAPAGRPAVTEPGSPPNGAASVDTPAKESAPAVDSPAVDTPTDAVPAGSDAGRPDAGRRPDNGRGPAGRDASEPEHAPTGTPPGWQTAADDGWRAATAAADVHFVETTPKGLPKRVPMAQLVPGGVDKGTSTVQRRTPEAVRGLLSAYHRGVQRGRTQQPKDADPKTPEPTTAGPQSSQAGKEQEA